MAAPIIEILGRNGSRYHKIESQAVRVGRALDNDVILSDPTVSPYHFVVRKNAAGNYALYSLADENGIRVGRKRMQEPIELTALPLEFEVGRTRIRILDRSGALPPTRLISCHNGGACVFGHWYWALFLFTALVLLSAIDNYLSTPRVLSWESYGSDQLTITLAALGLSVGMLAVNRITSHRWDYPSALSFVSLTLISALLLDLLIPLADYFFTSPAPGFIANLTWTLVLVPMFMGWFLIRLHHGSTAASMLIVVLTLSPAAFVQLKTFVAHYDLFNTFSKTAYYSDALYPGDKRLRNTISIEEFAQTGIQLAGHKHKEK